MKNAAVFTISHNENVWLPVWVRHYTRQGFDPTDIYVLDHMSKDGSTMRQQGCHRMLVDHDTQWDHKWLVATVEHFQKKLLEKYDYVVFTATDEYICVDPSARISLRDFLNKLNVDVVGVPCFNVVHDVLHNEPALNTDKPILAQRSLWMGPLPGKPLISRINQNFSIGFNACEQSSFEMPVLRVVHTRWADRDIMIRRILSRLGKDSGDSTSLGYNNRNKCPEYHVKELLGMLEDPCDHTQRNPTQKLHSITSCWKAITI